MDEKNKSIIAYRAWTIGGSDKLTSVYKQNVIWTPGEAIVSNMPPNFHGADPNADTSWGIHAFKNMGDLLQWIMFRKGKAIYYRSSFTLG